MALRKALASAQGGYLVTRVYLTPLRDTIQRLACKTPDLRALGRHMYANRNIHLHCNGQHLLCKQIPGLHQNNSLF